MISAILFFHFTNERIVDMKECNIGVFWVYFVGTGAKMVYLVSYGEGRELKRVELFC